jgi:hypothetical protein
MDRGIPHERSVGGYAAKVVAVGGTGAHDRQGRKGRRGGVVQRGGTALRLRHVRAEASLGSVRGRQASPHCRTASSGTARVRRGWRGMPS